MALHLGIAIVALACVHLCEACAPHNTTNWQQRNYDTVRAIYNLSIFPNNQAFLKQGVSAIPPGLFNANATGRITPVGNFSGLEDSVEYFFGLTPPVQPPLFDTWSRAEIASFSSGCPEVASSVVYGETTGVVPNASTFGQKISTIKQVAFWRFDSAGAVIAYEAWLPSLQEFTNLLYGYGGDPSPAAQAAVIGGICARTQDSCQGADQQYSSVEDCQKQLSEKPFGDWDRAWSDSIVCRVLHVLLAKLRPQVHCSHVGPSGGGKCTNVNYNDVYFDDQQLFGRPAGDIFMCPGIVR